MVRTKNQDAKIYFPGKNKRAEKALLVQEKTLSLLREYPLHKVNSANDQSYTTKNPKKFG